MKSDQDLQWSFGGSEMKLLIHDLTSAEWDVVADNYKDWTIISDTGAIRPCIGCFHCWASGTGECVFKDGYHQMGALIHEAEEVVFMSGIRMAA